MATKFKNVPFGTEVPTITNNTIALKDFTVDFTGATVCGLTTYRGPTWYDDLHWFTDDEIYFNGEVHFCGSVTGLPSQDGPKWTWPDAGPIYTETYRPFFSCGLMAAEYFEVRDACGATSYLRVDGNCSAIYTSAGVIYFDRTSPSIYANEIKLHGGLSFDCGGILSGPAVDSGSSLYLSGMYDLTCATYTGQITFGTDSDTVSLKVGNTTLDLSEENIQKIKGAAGIS